MTAKELVAQIRQLILNGVGIECISIICGLEKYEIRDLLQKHYTNARAMKLWERATNNNDCSCYVDGTICDDLFVVLEGKPILYSSMLTSDYYAKKLVFGIFTIRFDPIKEYMVEFSESEWCIIAKKASNEIGMTFAICGPNEEGNEMELKNLDEIPSKLINQFLRKAYNELVN